ncbi:hypothetical protein Fmac_009544 [Flemingia macrophylla]|uniref:Uncharacterized protein n=1 Tax=Flemingia macrophylla TaxID=520843 RepID=A0ABD1N0L7_9FABA
MEEAQQGRSCDRVRVNNSGTEATTTRLEEREKKKGQKSVATGHGSGTIGPEARRGQRCGEAGGSSARLEEKKKKRREGLGA